MLKSCIFGTIGNAGMSFTEKINSNLVKMYNYTCSCFDEVCYADFQKMINENCGISESNVRMYSPFLFSHGFINDYKNKGDIKISDFFTQLGKAFVKSLIVSSMIENESHKVLAQNITKDILALSMFRRKEIDKKEYYFDFLEFCVKYDSISVKEFNYMLYEKEMLNNENYIDGVSAAIQQFRCGDIDFIFLQDRVSKQGEKVREAFPDNTFNYTRNLLLESGLINELENKTYVINSDKKYIVHELLEGVIPNE